MKQLRFKYKGKHYVLSKEGKKLLSSIKMFIAITSVSFTFVVLAYALILLMGFLYEPPMPIEGSATL